MGKKLPRFFFIFFLCLGNLYAQQVTVKIQRPVLDPATQQILVPYQLAELKPHQLRYDIALYYSTNEGKSYIGPLRQVSGDVGEGVLPGADKQIAWNFLLEAPELTEKGNLVKLKFKIVTRTNEAAKKAAKSALGGPENALLSVLVPGLGDGYVRQGKGYGAITFVTWGTLATGLVFRWSARKNYDNYLGSSNTAELDHFFFLAQSHKKASNWLIASAVGIWVTDVVLVAVRGFRNLKKRQEISILGKKVYPHFGLNYSPIHQQPNLSLRFRF